MLAVLRTVSRQVPRATARRCMASDARFPAASGSQSQSISDPQPGAGNTEQPTSSGNPPKEHSNGSSLVPAVTAFQLSPPSSEVQAHPFAGAKEYADNQELAKNVSTQSNLPSLLQQRNHHESSAVHTYASPPFDTHRFFSELERTFPASTANSLMRATRALLVDRLGRVRREALSLKDLENEAYLFRAALSEARNEITLAQRNDSATIRTSLAALRREIDNLDGKMKSDIANLKHELQMDVDNRKTESKTDLKQMDITIEEVLNKAIVSIGDMRATTEQMKWENMYRSVLALGAFAVMIVVTFELSHTPSPKVKQVAPMSQPPTETKKIEGSEGLEFQMT